MTYSSQAEFRVMIWPYFVIPGYMCLLLCVCTVLAYMTCRMYCIHFNKTYV